MSIRIKAILTSTLSVAIILLALGIVGYNDTHYTREGVVTAIEDSNVVIVQDKTNNIWAFESDGNYNQNDSIQMTMCTNGTDNIITDDEIIKVSKIN